MKCLSLFFICLLITSPVYAAEKSKTKNNTKSNWNPVVYSENQGRLPKNYSGLDAKKFYTLLKAKVNNLEKREFETSEDYEKRTKDVNALLSPIKTTDLYAFKIDFDSEYNADSQAFSIKTWNPIESFCEALINRKEDKWVTCKVAAVDTERTKYRGTNAYGASIQISKNHITYLALAIPKESQFLNEKFTVKNDRREGTTILGEKGYRPIRTYEYQDELSIPIEKAKSIKNTKIAGLVVGYVTDAKIIKNLVDSRDPTFDYPIDKYLMYEAVPFEVKKIIYYVVQTGEILYQKSF
jgi:hypothetical protein